MGKWQKSLAESLESPAELAGRFHLDAELLQRVAARYPMRISRYYLGLIESEGDPIWLQSMPDLRELSDSQQSDPLNEAELSPVPGLIHRYPDRVVWLVSNQCATYCRFCMRKGRVGCRGRGGSSVDLPGVLDYISANAAIRDVILSGGDPLLLEDDVLEAILTGLRRIPHLEIIRIGTRAPVTLPERITPNLCRMLKQHHPLFVNTHFNHPREITAASALACARLADAGISLGNQSVLLKGVNDNPEVMVSLMQRLLAIRVRPYYIHQMDLVQGTRHFRTRVGQGIAIMESLRGHTSGLAVPAYVVDLPGGKGKVPLLPEYATVREGGFLLRNHLGEIVSYDDIPE